MLLKVHREVYRKDLKTGAEGAMNHGAELFARVADYISPSFVEFFPNTKGYRRLAEIPSVPGGRLIVRGRSVDATSEFYDVTAELQYVHQSSIDDLKPIISEIEKMGLEKVPDDLKRAHLDAL
jgi:hypothetical protein